MGRHGHLEDCSITKPIWKFCRPYKILQFLNRNEPKPSSPYIDRHGTLLTVICNEKSSVFVAWAVHKCFDDFPLLPTTITGCIGWVLRQLILGDNVNNRSQISRHRISSEII